MAHAPSDFFRDEDGAVTVDWVVLTAGVCMLIITMFTYLRASSYEAVATGINGTLLEAQAVATAP